MLSAFLISVTLFAGPSDVLDKHLGETVYGVELGIPLLTHEFNNADGTIDWIGGYHTGYAYSGFRFGLHFDDFEISVSAAAGYYHGTVDLGWEIEFREDIQVRWGWFVVGLSHLSNAGFGHINPATEILYVGVYFG